MFYFDAYDFDILFAFVSCIYVADNLIANHLINRIVLKMQIDYLVDEFAIFLRQTIISNMRVVILTQNRIVDSSGFFFGFYSKNIYGYPDFSDYVFCLRFLSGDVKP